MTFLSGQHFLVNIAVLVFTRFVDYQFQLFFMRVIHYLANLKLLTRYSLLTVLDLIGFGLLSGFKGGQVSDNSRDAFYSWDSKSNPNP